MDDGDEFYAVWRRGATLVSKSVTSTTAATLVIATGAGTGTLTITDSNGISGTITIAQPALALNKTSGLYAKTVTITAAGTNTLWSSEVASTLFSASAGTISSISVSNNTSATFSFAPPAANEVVTITDNSTGQTATFTSNGYGSIQWDASWDVISSGTNLMANQTVCSLSCFVKVNSFTYVSGTIPIASGGSWAISVIESSGEFQIEVNGTTDVVNNTGTTILVPGQVYHIAVSWGSSSQTIYLNGVAISAHTGSNTTIDAVGQDITVGGSLGSNLLNAQISDLALWNGYALTSTDVLNLRNRTYTPASLPTTPANSWWTFGGTANANPAVSPLDIGLTDQIGSLNFATQSGTATNATYAGKLAYIPPTTLVPYVGKSGGLVHLVSTVSTSGLPIAITNILSAPTISVNGTAVSTWGPLWLRNSQSLPVASYVVACGSVKSILITNPGAGYTSPSASASGVGGTGLTLGTPVVSGGVTSYSVTSGGSGYNYTPGVYVTGGGGFGAIGRCTMSGGSVQSISVFWPGSGYTSTPTVEFFIPVSVQDSGISTTGSGAAATCTVSNVVSSIPVTAGGHGFTAPPTISISDSGSGNGATAIAVMGNIQPTDVVTYSASDSWLYSSAGQAPRRRRSTRQARSRITSASLSPALAGISDLTCRRASRRCRWDSSSGGQLRSLGRSITQTSIGCTAS